MKKRFLALLFGAVLCMASFGHAVTPWTGIIDSARATDWSTAGVSGGVPNRTVICSTLNAGATAAQVSSALTACPDNQVVFLNAGTYNLSAGLTISRSNVVLRGAGADKTFLVMGSGGHAGCVPDGGASICIEGDGQWPGGVDHSANWTAGYAKGATSITLDSTTGIVAGTTIINLDQTDDSSDGGGIYVCETVGTCAQESAAGGERTNRAQEQIVLVTAVVGNTVTISPALNMPNWRSSQAPGAWWASKIAANVGIEDLSIDNTLTHGNGIAFVNAYNGWVQGVRDMDSNRNHVWIYDSARITIQHNYFWQTQNHASQSYGIEAYMSSDWLAMNNIFQDVTTPFQLNGSSSGGVMAYNFTINNEYGVSGWMIAGLSWHAAGVDFNLMEGNDINAMVSDSIHGTHSFTTVFRNFSRGWENTKTTQTNPAQIYFGSRFYNFIGNILGKSGYHTVYESDCPAGSTHDKAIWVLGGLNNGGASPCDGLVKTTMFRWGNVDVVNNAPQWNSAEVPTGLSTFPNAVPASHTLPASFFLSSQPAWWGSVPWPAIGPDVTGGPADPVSGTSAFGMVYGIPARNAYFNCMHGNATGTGAVLTFNRTTCYSTTPVTVPGPPTGLTATPQ